MMIEVFWLFFSFMGFGFFIPIQIFIELRNWIFGDPHGGNEGGMVEGFMLLIAGGCTAIVGLGAIAVNFSWVIALICLVAWSFWSLLNMLLYNFLIHR